MSNTFAIATNIMKKTSRDRSFYIIFFFLLLMVLFSDLIVFNYSNYVFSRGSTGRSVEFTAIVVDSPGLAELLLRQHIFVKEVETIEQAYEVFHHYNAEIILVSPPEIRDLVPQNINIMISVIYDKNSVYSLLAKNRIINALEDISKDIGEQRMENARGSVPKVQVKGVFPMSRPTLSATHSLYGFLLPFIFLFLVITAGNIIMDDMTQEIEDKTLEPLLAKTSTYSLLAGKGLGVLLLIYVQAVVFIFILSLKGAVISSPLTLLIVITILCFCFETTAFSIIAFVRDRKTSIFVYFNVMSAIFLWNFTNNSISLTTIDILPSKIMLELFLNPQISLSPFKLIVLGLVFSTIVFSTSVRKFEQRIGMGQIL